MSTAVEQPTVGQAQAGEGDAADARATAAAANAGDASGQAQEAAAGPAAHVQELDFSAPTKFTTELRRRIGRVLTPFCKALSTRMTTDLRAQVELRKVDARQLTWTEARASLPEESLLAAIHAQPIGKQMLLALELPQVLRSLDCLLGGSAAEEQETRKLSEIDWALSRRLVESIVFQLSLVWRDLGGVELSMGEVDVEGDAGLIVPIAEPTFAVTFEWEIAGIGSTFSLLVPWAAIEPVAAEILGSGNLARDTDPREAGAVHRGLAAAKVLLRAEVGARMLPVEQVLALEQGSLVRLDARAEHGVTLLAENMPLAHGVPGRSGIRRAIKLTTPIEPESELGIRTAPGAAASAPAQLSAASTQLSAASTQLSAASTQLSAAPAHLSAAPDRRAMLEGLARLKGVDVRLWAELGRTHMSLSDALRLPQGSVVELDQGAEDSVELFVNGLCFASGTLAVTADGDWAIQVGALI